MPRQRPPRPEPGERAERPRARPPARPETTDPAPVVAGRLGGPWGVRGWLHVRSFLEPAELLFAVERLWLSRREGWQALALDTVRPQGRGFVAHLPGVDDRTEAQALRGADIGVLRTDLPAAEAGEFYWEDLLGLAVVNEDEVPLGRVERFMETGANDVMVVAGERERLIPFAMDHVVRTVDLDAGTVTVRWHPDD